jgi:hypothetical protein
MVPRPELGLLPVREPSAQDSGRPNADRIVIPNYPVPAKNQEKSSCRHADHGFQWLPCSSSSPCR